jgi:hypothetical protein
VVVDDQDGDPRGATWRESTPPWWSGSSVFADVQRRGLHAATQLVDRLIRTVDGDREGWPEADRDRLESGPTEDLVRLWVEMVRLGLDVFGQYLPQMTSAPSEGATIDVETGVSSGLVRIESCVPGSSAGKRVPGRSAEVWLHNRSTRSHRDVSLFCGDLRASDGRTLPSSVVRFAPRTVDLPPRSSRGVVASMRDGAPCGTYRGVILAAGLSELWVPIEVAVIGPAEADPN